MTRDASSSDNTDGGLDTWISEDEDESQAGALFYPLSQEALAEIARASEGVDMASMPDIPPDAPCRLPDAIPDDWFEPLRNPDWAAYNHTELDDVAAELCDGCPVLNECLQWALDNPLQGGILGGTTERMREVILGATGDR